MYNLSNSRHSYFMPCVSPLCSAIILLQESDRDKCCTWSSTYPFSRSDLPGPKYLSIYQYVDLLVSSTNHTADQITTFDWYQGKTCVVTEYKRYHLHLINFPMQSAKVNGSDSAAIQ